MPQFEALLTDDCNVFILQATEENVSKKIFESLGNMYVFLTIVNKFRAQC